MNTMIPEFVFKNTLKKEKALLKKKNERKKGKGEKAAPVSLILLRP